MTFARIARKADKAERRAAVRWAEGLELRAGPFLLDRVALYTWAEDRSVRSFRIVCSRPLPNA